MAESRPPLEQMTLRQLRKIAIEIDIPQYSRMRKRQLLNVIQAKQNNLPSDDISLADVAIETSNKIKTNVSNILPQKNDESVTNVANIINQKQDDETLTSIANTTNQEQDFANLLNSDNLTVNDNSFEPQETDTIKQESSDIFADIDDDNGELPETYGQKKIVLMPCDSQWAYVYWDIPAEDKAALRSQGGTNLSLRLYDVTDVGNDYKRSQNTLEYICDESATNWYIPIPLNDRDYIVEIGYRCIDGKWLSLASSQSVSIPTLASSNWQEDTFVSVSWEQNLDGSSLYSWESVNQTLSRTMTTSLGSRVDGSGYRQINNVPGSVPTSISSFQFASGSGMGMWASGSGIGLMSGSGMGLMSGMGMMSGMGLMSGSGMGLMSGMGMMSGSGIGMWASGSGIGLMSGAGLTRQFWLMANAHLTVYGATVPDAKLKIANQPVKLNPDGTFTFQIAFPDGLINCPVVAVSADGVETRSIQMEFDRQTSFSNTEVQEASENLIEKEPPTAIKEVIDQSVSFSANEPNIHDLSIYQDNDVAEDSAQEKSTKEASNWFPPVDEDDASDWFPPII